MEKLVKGDIVVIPFPFSNLADYKKRPALVLANSSSEDILLAQITSKKTSNLCIKVSNKDFLKGNLNKDSFVKVNKLFSADTNIVLYRVGTLKEVKLLEIQNKLIDYLKN
ncbi:MAG: type II toxin-antitoxin system PemK/MazF family toxin [Candidatus Woesearchaeota archaeon]